MTERPNAERLASPSPDPAAGKPAEGEDAILRLLRDARGGDAGAAGRLMDMIYEELRRLARAVFRDQKSNHTLQPTTLIHDAFVRLVQSDKELSSRRHFFALAAKAMRQILTDHARRKGALKRPGERDRVSMSDPSLVSIQDSLDVVALDEALKDLAALNERHARLVELRFFGGLTIEEAAEELEVSRQTAVNDWTTARAWLRAQLSEDDEQA